MPRGRKKGSKGVRTLEKEQARLILRELVLKDLEPLIEAQKANARGINYLVSRDKKTGKFTRLTEKDEHRLQAGYVDDEREVIEIWAKDPSIQAFSDLMNRAIDKPIEPIQMEHSGSIALDERIKAARKRASRS